MEALFSFLYNGLAFVIALSLLVFVHEWGHYFVARLCGVRIEVFSIGFGKEIWGRTDKNGTRWKFSYIPLGGYVKFFGDAGAASNPDDDSLKGMTPEEKAVAFHFKPLYQRAAIVFAGPAVNILFAVFILAGFFGFLGQPYVPPVVDKVVAGSAAERAGFLPGDEIVSIDGDKVESFRDVLLNEVMNVGSEMEVEILRHGQSMTLYVTPEFIDAKDIFGDPIKLPQLGLGHNIIIGSVSPGSPAERAGLKPGDRLETVNGEDISTFRFLQDTIRDNEGSTVSLGVVRNGQNLAFDVTPHMETFMDNGEERTAPIIGIVRAYGVEMREFGFFEAIWGGIVETRNIVERSFVGLWQIISGDRPARELGGPIKIAQIVSISFEEGILSYINIIAMISINLGIINLLPIPMLDGGHLLFYGFEAALGRKLSERTQEYGFRIGLVIILGLMIFATMNDLMGLAG
ncbi:RIP metalloprotease RseP [Emcibacter nanhaiensis]|uniref:Zinc metalloprotease n=1 Tax=Emcibacter nanhaiensis TaxID=1505037 RepID=A0A501PS69_9PROT|nr:RIP metalloprotease RseP [Emcibacter nanhaiensis]TPD62912.1 RIP metalloprotease RseP [Emcibacter nanhaiensis]